MSDAKSIVDQFREMLAQAALERLAASYCVASKAERKARLNAITELVLELDKIRKETIFATGLAEAVISSVIEGDWRAVESEARDLTFESSIDREEYVAAAKLYERFVFIAQAACRAAKLRAAGRPTFPH